MQRSSDQALDHTVRKWTFCARCACASPPTSRPVVDRPKRCRLGSLGMIFVFHVIVMVVNHKRFCNHVCRNIVTHATIPKHFKASHNKNPLFRQPHWHACVRISGSRGIVWSNARRETYRGRCDRSLIGKTSRTTNKLGTWDPDLGRRLAYCILSMGLFCCSDKTFFQTSLRESIVL